uniref:Uncharacterized protein n=1 Tax=Parascaris univalens TaxID=6257 RepID=A0A915A0C4_PARUN
MPPWVKRWRSKAVGEPMKSSLLNDIVLQLQENPVRKSVQFQMPGTKFPDLDASNVGRVEVQISKAETTKAGSGVTDPPTNPAKRPYFSSSGHISSTRLFCNSVTPDQATATALRHLRKSRRKKKKSKKGSTSTTSSISGGQKSAKHSSINAAVN